MRDIRPYLGEIPRDRDKRILERGRLAEEPRHLAKSHVVISPDRLDHRREYSVPTRHFALLAQKPAKVAVPDIGTRLAILYVERYHPEPRVRELRRHFVREEYAVRERRRDESLVSEPADDIEHLRMHQRLASAERDGLEVAVRSQNGELLLQPLERLAFDFARGVVARSAAAVASAQDVQYSVRDSLPVPWQPHHFRSSSPMSFAPRAKNSSPSPKLLKSSVHAAKVLPRFGRNTCTNAG